MTFSERGTAFIEYIMLFCEWVDSLVKPPHLAVLGILGASAGALSLFNVGVGSETPTLLNLALVATGSFCLFIAASDSLEGAGQG